MISVMPMMPCTKRTPALLSFLLLPVCICLFFIVYERLSYVLCTYFCKSQYFVVFLVMNVCVYRSVGVELVVFWE